MARHPHPAPPLPEPPRPAPPDRVPDVPELILPAVLPIRVLMRMESIAALLSGIREVSDPMPAATGITSGPGNQGTANVAHMTGQAGTGAVKLSIPRAQKFGTGGTAQGSHPS